MKHAPATAAAILAAATLGGCATRTVPDLPALPAAPAPAIATALRSDPPLPGEPTAGWHGLEPEAPAAGGEVRQASTGGKMLTVEKAVEVALRNNRELRATLREVGIARGAKTQAGVLPNPILEAEGMPAHGHLELGIEYPLTAALLAPVRAGAARAELEAARYRAAGAAVKLAYEVRAAYFAAQASQQKLALANQSLEAFVAGRDASRALFAAGNVVALDAATQEAAYEGARLVAAEAEIETLEARERLARLLGMNPTDVILDTSLPTIPASMNSVDEAEAKALANSIELKELRSRMDASASQANWARTAGWLPDVAVRGFAERQDEEWGFGAGVELALPIFDRKQGAARAAEAGFDAQRERYLQAAQEIRASARKARNRLILAHARAKHFGDVIVPTRARVMDEALLQYNAMQVGVFQLLETKRAQLQAELGHADAVRDYWTAAAAYEAVLAGIRVEAHQTSEMPNTVVEGGEGRGH